MLADLIRSVVQPVALAPTHVDGLVGAAAPVIRFDPNAATAAFGQANADNPSIYDAGDFARSFTGLDNVVHAYSNSDGTYRVQRTNGDPNFTQWGTFRTNSDGTASLVGDWGALEKRDSPGKTFGQALLTGAALAGGLGAMGFFSGGAAAAGGVAATELTPTAAATFNPAVDSALVGGSAYAGSVPAAVDLLGAGGLGIVPTGAVGGVLAGSAAAAATFNPAVDSALVGGPAYAGSVPAAVDLGTAGGIVSTGAVGGVLNGAGSAITSGLGTLVSQAKPILGSVLGALGGGAAGGAPGGSSSSSAAPGANANTLVSIAIIGAAVVAVVALRK